MKIKTELSLDRVQLYFLRERYGKRKGNKRLIKLAVLEAISSQARKASDELSIELSVGFDDDGKDGE